MGEMLVLPHTTYCKCTYTAQKYKHTYSTVRLSEMFVGQLCTKALFILTNREKRTKVEV